MNAVSSSGLGRSLQFGLGRTEVPGGDGGEISVAITLVMCDKVGMVFAQSKVTAQGQISVPAEVRRRLGLGPGSVLEWEQDGERIVVRKAGRYSSEEIHRELFSKTPKPKKTSELKEGIRRHARKKHARG